ncbi:hypothetical protein BGZ83_005654 [Gryganskiella cystojenkinii]|nr:hypothetical protein BGZ83_005654 [Gryganskiella cystojenkinii]
MSVAVPGLKRETTRALCDVYTTLFEDQETLLKASQSQSLACGDEVALPSPATTACTPGSTPCSDFDDFSLDGLDEVLSPPTSPWLSDVVDLDSSSISSVSALVPSFSTTSVHEYAKYGPTISQKSLSHQHNVETQNKDVSPAVSLHEMNSDIFSTLSYQQMPGQQQHQYPRRRLPSLSLAVRAVAKSKVPGASYTETASPADLYNISMDDILTSDGLELSPEQQKQLLSGPDFEVLADAVAVVTEATSSVSEHSFGHIGDVSMSSTMDHDDSSSSLSSAYSNSSQETITGNDHFNSSDEFEPLSGSQSSDMDLDRVPVVHGPDRGTSSSRRTGKAPKVPKMSKKTSAVTRGKKTMTNSSSRPLKIYPQRKVRAPVRSDDDQPSLSLTLASKEDVSLPHQSRSVGPSPILPMPEGGYRCDHCPNERFGRVHDLRRHQMSKHKDMTWPCDFCRRPFVRRDALLRHYAVKSQRKDGIHPTADEKNRLSEARARAKLIA